MSRYRLHPDVPNDLKEICRYISERNPGAAGRLRNTFFDAFRALAQSPGIGRARNDLAEDLRIFPVGDYVILYRPITGGIEVVQVVHGARDIDALFRRTETE